MFLKFSVTVLALLSGVLSASIDCNVELCPKPQILYQKLGCKAILDSKSCCAKRFECPTPIKKQDCRKMNCEIDLKYKAFVQRGCLPVFLNGKCCPVDWECPNVGKKIIKRSIGDDETQTSKQDVFVVTPSKNLEEYLSEVKLQNEQGLLDVSTSTQATTTVQTSTVQTTSAPIESTSVSLPEILVPTEIKLEENLRTEIKSLIDLNDSTAKPVEQQAIIVDISSPAAVSVFQIETTKSIIESSLSTSSTTEVTTPHSEIITSTTEEVTKPITTSSFVSTASESIIEHATSTEILTTTESADSKKLETQTSKHDVEIKEMEGVTEIPSHIDTTTTALMKASTIAIESSTAMLTTEALKELLKVLDQPETTMLPLDMTSSAQIISEEKNEQTTTSVESTTATQIISTTSKILEHEATTTVETPSTATEESLIETTKTETSTIAETSSSSSSSLAPTEPSYNENVFPTAFEKLLTTLKEFLADAEAATKAPELTTTTPIPQVEQKVEFVTFTVSEEHDDGSKIVKRSVQENSNLLKENSCFFNEERFKIGEVIKESDCLKCVCKYAPVGHCQLKEKCNL